VFKGSIEEIHRPSDPALIPGHPANTFRRENRAIEKLIKKIQEQLISEAGEDGTWRDGLLKLAEIDRHYMKKENLFFPYLEKYGITAPPKVMWGVDDEIRAELKSITKGLEVREASQPKEQIEAILNKITEMIFKEENILLPMLLENLTQDEWKTIADGIDELGYCLIEQGPVWNPPKEKEPEALPPKQAVPGVINLPTGILKTEELGRMLDALPIDITFVDKDDTVKYFSQGAERVFPRTKSILGRKVSNCHPPASVHIVEKLVEDFKAGRKDNEDFWIKMGEKFILIRYFAVRSEAGEYLGVLEVTQNIQPLRSLEGEKRLVANSSDEN
jgi:DUF438 domain-containing protein